MSVANSTSLTTQFNTSPYYDDFDEDKGFYRILFKPSLAVQARELTQLQTILQKQIDRFGEHIFKEGSLVLGGTFDLNQTYSFVKIEDFDILSNPTNVADFLDKEVVGAASGVKGVVVNFAEGSEAADPDTKTLFVKYTASGTDGEIKEFLPGEQLDCQDGISVNVINDSSSIGMGSAFSIGAGVLFAKDHFISFLQQTIILDKYNPDPTLKVGFNLVESIINSNQDTTLLDGAQGSLNFAAPGADRLKIEAFLISVEIGSTDEDFVELFEIKDGIIQRKMDLPQYAIIKDEFARRTYDESGNYIVRGLTMRIREHLDDGTNFGLLLAEVGGNSNQLAIGISPGKAYVYGYEIGPLITQYVAIDKGIDFKIAEQQTIAANYGNYAIVNEVVGTWDINNGVTVTFYDEVQRAITTRNNSLVSPSGNILGTAKLKAMQYVSGAPGANTATYNAYLYDIVMSNTSFDSVKSIYYDGSGSDIFADIVLDGGIAFLNETNFNSSIFNIASSNIRSIRDENDDIDTTFSFLKNFNVTVGAGGTFSVSTSVTEEIFPFQTGALNASQKLENFIVSLNGSQTVALSGTVSVANNTSAVSGVSTAFTTQLKIGDKLFFTDTSQIRRITAIADNTNLTLDEDVTLALSGSVFKKQYLTGDIIDFNVNGTAATPRAITITSTTSASFDMAETLEGTVSATVLATLNRIDAKEIKKTILRDRYVLINCDTNDATNVGPWNLGLSDVYQIVEVRRSATPFSTINDGIDVTDDFTLDNGQRDNFYDHSKLKKRIGATVGASDYLLIKVDYFTHDTSQGVGYFSVDSYPIDDVNGPANSAAITTKEIPIYVSPTSGLSYNLRDSLDIRPTRAASANNVTSLVNITTNPAVSTTFTIPSGGLHTVAPNKNFIADLSYYLRRRDLIVVNPIGEFRAIRGIPALLPITPEEPKDSMSVAVIDIAPYPSLPSDIASASNRPQYANKVKNVGNRVYTMRDIGVLDKRITNLEYYITLTMAEQQTLNMKILDENGLDRFKNGILVDPFVSHNVGDFTNPDYKCSIDKAENELRPKFNINDISMQVASLSGLVQTGNIISLPYTHVEYTAQPSATTTRNAAGLFFKYIGELFLNPPDDYWVDTNVLPDLVINDDGNLDAWMAVAEFMGIDWNNWQTMWTGTSVNRDVDRDRLSGGGTRTTTTTTTTTTTNQQRTGTELVVSSFNKTENYGTRVVDVSLVPYMRSRQIRVQGIGFKALTKLYAFFDSEKVVAYITPTDSSYVPTASEGSDLITDAAGKFFAVFRIPSDATLKFTTGTKTLRFTDSFDNSSVAGSVTTAGETQYTASGLQQTKQDTIVSTTVPQVSLNTIQEARVLTNTNVQKSVRTILPARTSSEPIAQTFEIDVGNNIPGIFLTKLDLYFSTKDSTFGVFIELRELDAAGYITPRILPNSKVFIPQSSIQLSSDSSNATTITFPGPVFVLNNTSYAFVVKPEANNQNTSLWVAKLGEEDILTGGRVNIQPHAGILFISSNDAAWTPLHDEDLKFRLYRADFTVGSGTLVLTNNHYNFFAVEEIEGGFGTAQEIVNGEPRLTLSGITGGTILVGEKLRGNASTTEGEVTDISGSIYRVKDVPGGDVFNTGEGITVYYANNDPTGVTATLASQTTPNGVLEHFQHFSNNSTELQLGASTTGFVVGEQLTGFSSGDTSEIAEILDKPANVFDFEVSQIVFDRTSALWSSKTTSKNNVLQSVFNSVVVGDNVFTDVERKVASRQNEADNISGNKSLQLQGVLSTSTSYVSPIVDASRNHTIIVNNIINNDDTGENGTNGGNALARYMTQKVTLAEGQDAEDLQVILMAYRPPGADLRVYFKAHHAEDSDSMDDRSWFEADKISKDLFSNKENKNDMKDFTFSMPSSVLTGSNGEYQYVNSNGVTFTGFKYFAIKIVMLSEETSLVPRLKNLRVIALQK